MKERPILFSSAMVRAILAGTKVQTRRIVKAPAGLAVPQTLETKRWAESVEAWWPAVAADGRSASNTFVPVRCPYGVPGDRLYVKEAAWIWCEVRVDGKTPTGRAKLLYEPVGREVRYVADGTKPTERIDDHPKRGWRMKVGRFLPRWASRITLEVTGVRVERVQEIGGDDARAEGIDAGGCDCETCARTLTMCPATATNHVQSFAALWEEINGKRAPWSSNPWVWCVSFRRVALAETEPTP